MKKIILLISLFLWWFSFIWISLAADTSSNWECPKWSISLNTDVPWVWKCIKQDDAWDSFGKMMWYMMKLLINITVAVSFIALIAAGVMMTLSWVNQSAAWKWKELLKKVILWIVLLWLSWIILHTINPNFFKTGLTTQLIMLDLK